MHADAVTLLLCGDVMLGRGIDQILPYPGDPRLWERHVRDARVYVELAEAASGTIPRPADFSWPWGDALQILAAAAPDARLVNLETSITQSDHAAACKGVHYRMNPPNLPCLGAVRPDACALANNHVLDFGRPGLEDTLETLAAARLRAVGAGRDLGRARRPATIPVDAGRVLVLSVGTASSGIPASWAAEADRSGLDVVSERTDAGHLVARVRQVKQPGDIVIASVHWGSNWGYEVSPAYTRFAHALIDGGVDLVHGHSSHHPRPVEVYRDKLILYGCGDLINDYEGITGHEEYRGELRLLYLASVDPRTGRLIQLRMAPMQSRRMRLRRASREDSAWLRVVLDQISHIPGRRIEHTPDDMITLR